MFAATDNVTGSKNKSRLLKFKTLYPIAHAETQQSCGPNGILGILASERESEPRSETQNLLLIKGKQALPPVEAGTAAKGKFLPPATRKRKFNYESDAQYQLCNTG